MSIWADHDKAGLFPTPVGVNHAVDAQVLGPHPIPYTRGGEPQEAQTIQGGKDYSPHPCG